MNQPDQTDQPQTPRDNTGWAQPPAPEGPPGAFVDRQPVSSGPLPPGAGSPMQPGPPLSVEAPIKDTTINWVSFLLAAGGVLLVILIVAVLIASLTRH